MCDEARLQKLEEDNRQLRRELDAYIRLLNSLFLYMRQTNLAMTNQLETTLKVTGAYTGPSTSEIRRRFKEERKGED